MGFMTSMEEKAALLEHLPASEKFSFWSHAAGAVAAAGGLVLLLVLRCDRPIEYATVAVYGGSLVFLLSASALHHAWHPKEPHLRLLLRQVDHIAIFLLIAGTYTPFCLLALPVGWGLSILGTVVGLAVAGITLKLVRPFAPRWLGTGIYVLVGWCVVVAFVPLYDALSTRGLALMFGGGLAYTGGAVIYGLKRPDWWPRVVGFHGLWHLFVLAAAGMHFAAVAMDVL